MTYFIMYMEEADDWTSWRYFGQWTGDTPEQAVRNANLPTNASRARAIPNDTGFDVIRGAWVAAEGEQ